MQLAWQMLEMAKLILGRDEARNAPDLAGEARSESCVFNRGIFSVISSKRFHGLKHKQRRFHGLKHKQRTQLVSTAGLQHCGGA